VLLPIAILGAAILVSVVMMKSRPELAARAREEALPLVQVQTIRRQRQPVTLEAYGNVTAWRELALTAQVTGRVLWQAPRFEPGVVVAAGETLLRVDPTDYELALAEARQALASAELSLADATALRQAARMEEAEAAVAAARARITRAERDLDNTEIRAPYNAVVDTQQVELGQFVSVGAQLGRILGSDRAEIRLPITQQDIGLIDAASDAPVVLTATTGAPQQRWEGRIARIEARIDDATRVYPVVVEIEEPLNAALHGAPLPFGMFVRAQISGRAIDDAVRIPQAALHAENDVFLFEDGTLRRRSIQVLRLSDGMALVVGGLEDGERVVTTRLDLMFEGMQVALINE
jgi:RND family efflux transporter MFP subunit